MKALKQLDVVINKSRVHFYKPIQIAEILYRHRTKRNFKLGDLESYRNNSRKWRDEVTRRLTGSVSTSSQKYQDNLFDKNALPAKLIVELGRKNRETEGAVEAYIYKAYAQRLSSVYAIYKYIEDAETSSFSLEELVDMFTQDAGLKRSTDKMYEIIVYALFSSLVRELRVEASLSIKNQDLGIITDFEPFIKLVLGLDRDNTERSFPAKLYRLGATNAADRGLDIWANFGPAVQVKHITLTQDVLGDVMEEISADRIVIVCLDQEREAISSVLMQMGWRERIQGIVTLADLTHWYQICMSDRYASVLGRQLLADLKRGFTDEFPSIKEIRPFMEERGYAQMSTEDICS